MFQLVSPDVLLLSNWSMASVNLNCFETSSLLPATVFRRLCCVKGNGLSPGNFAQSEVIATSSCQGASDKNKCGHLKNIYLFLKCWLPPRFLWHTDIRREYRDVGNQKTLLLLKHKAMDLYLMRREERRCDKIKELPDRWCGATRSIVSNVAARIQIVENISFKCDVKRDVWCDWICIDGRWLDVG